MYQLGCSCLLVRTPHSEGQARPMLSFYVSFQDCIFWLMDPFADVLSYHPFPDILSVAVSCLCNSLFFFKTRFELAQSNRTCL